MQYLISLQKNLQIENDFLSAALNFRDQNVEKNYQNFQNKFNKGTVILMESFKLFFEFAITISAIISDYESIYSQILFLFPMSSLLQIWKIRKNQKCNDYWKMGHMITLSLFLAAYKQTYLMRGSVSLYCVYMTQSLNDKKYFIYYFTIMQVTFQCFDQFFDWIVLPFQWVFTLIVTICIYTRQRRELVYFFKKFKCSHDLSYQEAVLNHSLQQNLFVIRLSPDQSKRSVDYFEILFANQACKKEFAQIDNIFQRTTLINIINCNESNLSYYNLKVNFSYEQICNNYKGSTGEQINMVDKPISLNQILYQYIVNYQNKEMQESLPLKLTGLQNNQTFDILVSPCIWKHDRCFIISLIDLTDRIKISQLEKLDQYKDSVLATVSHDLKNPISVIQSMITLVQEGLYELQDCDNAGIQQQVQSCCNYLQMCQTNVQTLQSFVNDLQDFAQIKQQKLKLAVSQFEISNLIQEIKNVFQIQIQKKNLELEIQVNLKPNQSYYNDPLRIKQVLFNLISNAIKFTSKGKIIVKFSDDFKEVYKFCQAIKEQIDSNKSIVDVGILFKNKSKIFICTVTDNGSGMSLEIQRGLFRNFATYDNDTNINKNGVGLGLIICKQLCGYIGPIQYIFLRSQTGVGSTFQFAIYKNYDKQNRYDYSGDQSSIDSIDYDISVHSPYKNIFSTCHITPLYKKQKKRELLQVLIVDDETFNCILLKLQLTKFGILNMDVAYSGRDAIEMSQKKIYDIVFLDVNMPGMNGFQCIQDIKNTNGQIKIYMLTAFNDLQTHQMCLDAGADKLLSKPLSQKQLELLLN
ncbi:unnamed protein product [Paramecium sonneborni]|uniref:Uncharacterized protein n=1 Tax=Paramecium sonneborni TaxID=65129 RepID=A0A8S1QSD0_9CILI|nr:unnamed protein product [Paramecium sonneborni]